MGNASRGALTKVAIDQGTIDTGSHGMDFVSCSMRKIGTHIISPGIRGTRRQEKDRQRLGTHKCSGQLICHPSYLDLVQLLPLILGGTPSGTSYPLAEDCPTFNLMVDKIADVYLYDLCKCVRATIRGEQGGPITLTMDIEGNDEADGQTYPALTIPVPAPFVFPGDSVLTLASTARPMRRFELVIDNGADTDRHMNELGRSQIPLHDRIITVNTLLAFTSDELALHDMAIAGITGSIAMTNGTVSLTIGFTNAKFPAAGPPIEGKNELMLDLAGQLFGSGATDEIVVTLDSTP